MMQGVMHCTDTLVCMLFLPADQGRLAGCNRCGPQPAALLGAAWPCPASTCSLHRQHSRPSCKAVTCEADPLAIATAAAAAASGGLGAAVATVCAHVTRTST